MSLGLSRRVSKVYDKMAMVDVISIWFKEISCKYEKSILMNPWTLRSTHISVLSPPTCLDVLKALIKLIIHWKNINFAAENYELDILRFALLTRLIDGAFSLQLWSFQRLLLQNSDGIPIWHFDYYFSGFFSSNDVFVLIFCGVNANFPIQANIQLCFSVLSIL